MSPGDEVSHMPNEPDPAHFARYCDEILPGMLEVCEVSASDATRIVEDVSRRAEAVARMDAVNQEILAAPFYEESFTHEPDDAPAPLSHLIAARRQSPLPTDGADNPFADLPQAYPRAWACLEALRTCLNLGGGRIAYRSPGGPVPQLPDASGAIDAEPADNIEIPSGASGFAGVCFSGIDARFDHHGLNVLKTAAGHENLLLGLSSLSRVSRNSRKLLRVLEFLLAHQAGS
jgi:hypothetical protein